jgi:hypothetical protein
LLANAVVWPFLPCVLYRYGVDYWRAWVICTVLCARPCAALCVLCVFLRICCVCCVTCWGSCIGALTNHSRWFNHTTSTAGSPLCVHGLGNLALLGSASD